MHRNVVAFLVALVASLVLVSFWTASSGAASQAGKQVIAVDTDSTYPASAPRTSLSGYTPSLEAIVGYHPDLVLISYNPSGFAGQLRNLLRLDWARQPDREKHAEAGPRPSAGPVDG